MRTSSQAAERTYSFVGTVRPEAEVDRELHELLLRVARREQLPGDARLLGQLVCLLERRRSARGDHAGLGQTLAVLNQLSLR